MKHQEVLYLLGLGALGLVLLSNPRCNRGCRTIAEHLVSHVIDDLLTGLL
jgi:hypothetical protein